MSQAEEEMARKNRWYDLVLYLVVPAQYAALSVFLYNVTYVDQPTVDLVGKTLVMGLLCGVFGINVAHELGHRANKMEQFFAKALLLTSLYMHFFIEHNKGHHKRVATPEDPASARLGESLYRFYVRSIVFSYFSAWRIAGRDQRKKGDHLCRRKMKCCSFSSFNFCSSPAFSFCLDGKPCCCFCRQLSWAYCCWRRSTTLNIMGCKESRWRKENMKGPCRSIAGTATMR